MIRYQLTEEEVVSSLLKYRNLYPRLGARIGIGVLGLLLCVLAFVTHNEHQLAYLYIGGFFILFSVLSIVLTPSVMRRAFTKMVRGNSIFTDAKEVSFGESGLVFSSARQKSEVKWSYFKSLTEDDQYFYLHLDGLGNVTILPKRAFGASDLENFRLHSRFPPPA